MLSEHQPACLVEEEKHIDIKSEFPRKVKKGTDRGKEKDNGESAFRENDSHKSLAQENYIQMTN